MEKQIENQKIIELRRKAAEYFQRAAWNQLLSLDNYRTNNLEAADRFAGLSYEDQMNAVDCAELADAESSFDEALEIEDEIDSK